MNNTQGRAIGAVGPGDVKKLAEAGLTVVDTKAYQETLRLLDAYRVQAEQLGENLKQATKRGDELLAARRALCDLLSRDASTVAGQTLVEAVQAIINERDALRAQLQETYAHWREARNAELLLVRNDLEETRRTNRNLLEEYHTLAGRLSQSEGECARALASLNALRTAARAVVESAGHYRADVRWLVVDRALLEALLACVSSHNANPAPAQSEETREEPSHA